MLKTRDDRMLAAGLASVVLTFLGLAVLDWFSIKVAMPGGGVRVGIDLRNYTLCLSSERCVALPVSYTRDTWAMAASFTFWFSIVFTIAVAVGTCGRRLGIVMARAYGRRTAVLGALVLFGACITAFVFGPDNTAFAQLGAAGTVSRGLGGGVLCLGLAAGMFALLQLEDEGHEGIAAAPPMIAAEPVVAAAPVPTAPLSAPLPVQHAAATLAISDHGLDATFVGGNLGLVAWDDVVAAVARRLPDAAPYAGAVIVDLISGPHATIRVVPATAVTGVELPPADQGDGGDRVRALIAAVRVHQPNVKLDTATRATCSDAAPLRQLEDAAALAAHDARLP